MKNKFKIIAILTVIILALTVGIVRADDEPVDAVTTSETGTENTEGSGETVENPDAITDDDAANTANPMLNMKSSDVYLTGDTVDIDYVVDGNLFIFANTVNINSQIGGDAFIVAKTINVSQQGYIFNNLFALAQDVNISGIVYDLYSSSQNVTIEGYVYRDLKITADTLNLKGLIGRNAYVSVNNINFPTPAEGDENTSMTTNLVAGTFNYTAPQEITIPAGVITGEVNYTKLAERNSKSIQDYIIALGKFITTVVVIWLLCLWIAPKFLSKVNNISVEPKKLLPIAGYGILAPIVLLIAFAVLLLLGLTSSIAILALVALFVIVCVSTSMSLIAVNSLVCKKFKVEKTIGILGCLIATTAVLWLISLIPYVGTIVGLLLVIMGIGIIVKNILPESKKETKKEDK